MRLLLLSDIHANQTALEAVLAHAGRRYDQVVQLGDALGYGPHPREVLQTLRDLQAVCIEGNHERMLLQYDSGELPRSSESVVGTALRYQLTQLAAHDVAWVRSWPDGIEDPGSAARYRHGTPLSLDDYLDSVTAAREVFAGWPGRIGFVGHTHTPAVYATLNAPVGEWIKTQTFPEGGSYLVPPAARVILNPGSVGQPRDGHPEASYATFDTARGHFEVFRVPYDVARTQQAIREAGLPEVLAARLAIGK